MMGYIGYRIWEVLYHIEERRFFLYCYLLHHAWYKEMEAVCLEGDVKEHLRDMTHNCGIYSYNSPNILFKRHERELVLFPVRVLVAGEISNFGVVARYTEGYRSSHCEINTLFLPQYICQKCYLRTIRKAEFVLLTYPPYPRAREEARTLEPICLHHYPREKDIRVFSIETIKIELERHYEVPVRDLKELIGGR